MAQSQIELIGKSGQKYIFDVHPSIGDWGEIPCVYIVIRLAFEEPYQTIYLGQTDNLRNCLINHDHEDCFRHYNWTHVCIHEEADKETRLAIETDLLDNYPWPCNGIA